MVVALDSLVKAPSVVFYLGWQEIKNYIII